MAESNTKQQQDEPNSSKSFVKLPMKEAEERTVITVTTDRQITEVDEPTQDEEDNPVTAEVTKTDEVTEIYTPPPTATVNQTLTTQIPTPTSPIGCSTAHCSNGRDATATPTKP